MKTLGKCSVNSQKLTSKGPRQEERPPFPGVGAETKCLMRVWRTGLATPRDAPVFCRCGCARCKFTCSFLGNTPTLPVPAGTSRGRGVGRCSLGSLGRVRGWPRVSSSEGDPHPERAGRAPRRVPGDPQVPGVTQRGEAGRVGGREPGRGAGWLSGSAGSAARPSVLPAGSGAPALRALARRSQGHHA